MNAILEAEELVKRYPGVTAVDGPSFGQCAGSRFGMLGPNGAGKTTDAGRGVQCVVRSPDGAQRNPGNRPAPLPDCQARPRA